MFDKKDYLAKLNRIKRKRSLGPYKKYMVYGAAALAVIVIVILIITGIRKATGTPSNAEPKDTAVTESQAQEDPQTPTLSPEEESLAAAQTEAEGVVNSYTNLGIVQVSGYLNMRKEPSTGSDVIGKLSGDSACEVLETQEEWYKISSGGIEGYIHSEFVLTGQEAKEKAKELVKRRAVVQTDKLNIRKEPGMESDILGQAYTGERYEVIAESDGWVQTPSGYISAEFVKVEPCLNEARKLDLKSMVLNLYDNLGISNVDSYLNVRESPSEDGKIIGKMPSRSACDILETQEGWYKIRSGNITGYVKSDFILRDTAAKDLALETAELMAVVSTDRLNVRTEPSKDAPIWSQISNNEKYAVLKQTDGWVEIELDTTSAFVATEFVDVRYGLPEAIKFSPLEEKANAEASLRNQIVNYAMQFLGNPYVWGGTSLTKGADCSGFTLSVLGKYGIGLPHYSVSQSNMGKKIESSAMRPGDLIFYSDKSGTINHVAMYIGNGQIIHAANRRSGIKISTWNYRNPVKIRNVID